jgi:signal transduction histidine kinase
LDESNFKRAVDITLRPIVKGIKCNVTMQFSRLPFNDTSTHIILSILRELSSNAVSHGKATILSISGVIKSHRLIFTVRDNGCGFDPSSAPALDDGHFGLEGIRMRLRQLSGMIEISSAPNEGTVITLSLPV